MKKEFIYFLLVAFFSVLLVLDLFLQQGQPATYDGPTHITMIAQFYKAFSEGEIRPTWSDGFANYGMPMALIHQQTTTYLGGVLNFIFHDVVLSYNSVLLTGAMLSSLFFYIFLRFYFNPDIAFFSTFLFNFAPYRILNIYVRGALPEFFASVFIASLLIGVYLIEKRKNAWSFILTSLSVTLLILTHPFMFIVCQFVIVPYFVFLLITTEKKRFLISFTACSFIVGIGLSSFYLFPLTQEIKYFYYGLSTNHFVSGHFLTAVNYITESWPYFTQDGVFTRPQRIYSGIIETAIILFGLLSIVWLRVDKTTKKFLFTTLISVAAIVFFTTQYSYIFYKSIQILSNIQHPWRMFSALMFLPPIIFAILATRYKKIALWMGIIIVLSVSFLRFPQLYGKNYFTYSQEQYFFTEENLGAVVLNTIWTGQTRDYPVKKIKGEIIEGEGVITQKTIKNSSREYVVLATTPIRMADYTFYFPGWNVYVDNKKADIQFQDPDYRGVITYTVPPGQHRISVRFEDTKVRVVGKLLSFSAVLVLIGIFMFKRRGAHLFAKVRL